MAENVVPRRQYTQEFKVEAVRLSESVGQHEAARRLGVPVATELPLKFRLPRGRV